MDDDKIFNKLIEIETKMATQADIKRLEATLDSHTQSLDGIAKDMETVKQELA